MVLENAGRVDPERLDDYIAAGGYGALGRAISELSPKEVVDEVREATQGGFYRALGDIKRRLR